MASLGSALLLNAKRSPLKPLFRTIFFAPVVTTLVAVAIVWRYMFHPRFGLLNTFLGWFGVDAIERIALGAIGGNVPFEAPITIDRESIGVEFVRQ